MLEHYTYLHRKANTGEIFYVGKGKNDRAWSKSKRSTHWQRIANKHGIVVEIVARWSSAHDAFEHERFLIWCFRDMGVDLCNHTGGGDGLRDPSPEVRAKLSAALKGKPGRPMKESTKLLMSEKRRGSGNPMFGRTVTPEAKRKRFETLAATGYKPSSETGRKISEALKNGYHPMRGKTGASHHGSKAVVCIDTGTRFDSIGDAVRWLRGNGHPSARDWNVGAVCRGERKVAYGLRWKFNDTRQRTT